MKIVDRKTFLALPPETLFAKYHPCVFGDLCIKMETVGNDDFIYQQIADSLSCSGSDQFHDLLCLAENRGDSLAFDFDLTTRDGMYDADQLFAVWEPGDVGALIARLQRCAAGVAPTEGGDDADR